MDPYTRVRAPYVEAYMWWCCDEVCDCTQPRIERRTPAAYGFTTTTLWEGTFESGAGGDESRAQEAELAAEAARRHIPLGRTLVSRLPSDVDLSHAHPENDKEH